LSRLTLNREVEVKFVPVIMVAVMALGAIAGPAMAQSGVGYTGGNATYTLPTSDDAGTTVSESRWTSFNYSFFYAAFHGWMAGASVQTSVRIGLPSARAVRFASAGRPDARMTRVTGP
jgi:hypothetical protein